MKEFSRKLLGEVWEQLWGMREMEGRRSKISSLRDIDLKVCNLRQPRDV
jgi:hypothetical protein